MDSDVFLVGEDPQADGPEPQTPWPMGWIAPIGLIAVAAVILLTTNLPSASENDLTTSSVLEVPTMSVPIVVDETVTWEQVSGLEGAEHIGGVARLGDAWWAIGSTGDGLAAWATDGGVGRPWKLASQLTGEEGGGWMVTDVDTFEGSLVVAAAARDGLGGGSLFSSRDGLTWTGQDLPSTSTSSPVTSPIEVITTSTDIRVRGFSTAYLDREDLLHALPEDVSLLVEENQAQIGVDSFGLVKAWVAPGLEIASIHSDTFGAEPRTVPLFMSQVWRGTSLDDLTVTQEELFPWGMQATAEGSFLGPIGVQLAVSDDGEDWTPVGAHIGELEGFIPWRDGAVVWVRGDEPAHWTAAAADTTPLLPDELLGHPIRRFGPAVASDVGLVLLAVDVGPTTVEAPRTVVEEADDDELVLTRDLTLEFVREGKREWAHTVWNTTVELDESGRLRFGAAPDSMPVAVDRWLDALRRHPPPDAVDAKTLNILHTVDGHEWGSVTWSDITGSEVAVPPSLFATEGLILALDQTQFPLPELNGAWMARSSEGRPAR